MTAVECCGFNCGYCRSLCRLLLHVQAVLLLLCVLPATFRRGGQEDTHYLPRCR
jgi:hypothetical protein